MQKEQCVLVRKTIVSCILATDMTVHFALIEDIKKKHADAVNFSLPAEQIFICKFILHAADLSNPVRPFEISKVRY